MNKNPTATGVEYKCSACSTREIGEPDDTLIEEGFIKQSSKLTLFLENTPYDLAANRIPVECPRCGMPYMNKVIIDENRATYYLCKCGNSFSHADYVAGKHVPST